MDNNNKNYYIIGGIIIILIIIGALIYHFTHKSQLASNSGNPAGQNVSVPSPTATPTSAVGSNPNSAASTAYMNALATYPDRIQFNQCLAVINGTGIGSLAIRQGDKFMLDNRDPSAHTFGIFGQNYSVAGYGFAIITAGKTGEFPLSCDGDNRVLLNIES